VATLLVPPSSFMGAVDPAIVTRQVQSSPLHQRYAQAIDRESAREVLMARAKESADAEDAEAPAGRSRRQQPQSTAGQVAQAVLKSSVVAALGRELVRGVFGVLGLKKPRRR
jgi:hypothetical protein